MSYKPTEFKGPVTVGQPLAYEPHTSYRWDAPVRYSFGWVVERVTPTGKGVAVRKDADGTERRIGFQQQGHETQAKPDGSPNANGVVAQWGGRFITTVEAAHANVERRTRLQVAAAALNAVRPEREVLATWNPDYIKAELVRLEALLNQARIAVGEL